MSLDGNKINFQKNISFRYRKTIQIKMNSLDKNTFISNAKWNLTFNKFIFRNYRLPKMVFSISMLAAKLKRVDLSVISSSLPNKSYSHRYSRLIRELSYKIFKYTYNNILKLTLSSPTNNMNCLSSIIKLLFHTESVNIYSSISI